MKKLFLFAPFIALFVGVSFGANYSAPSIGMVLSLKGERFSINTDGKTIESIKPFPSNSCTNYEILSYAGVSLKQGSLDGSNTISVNLPIPQGNYVIIPVNCGSVGASSSMSQIGGTDLTFIGGFSIGSDPTGFQDDRHFFIQTFSVIDTPVAPSGPNVSFGITSSQTTTLGSGLLNSGNFLFSLFVRLAPFLVAFAIIFIAVSMISRYFMIGGNRKKTKK